uniref:Uncharacterized protein n=1 Tax=Globodera rostochiensis TaxID=31243 RepID=A0A914I1V9_GLORO
MQASVQRIFVEFDFSIILHSHYSLIGAAIASSPYWFPGCLQLRISWMTNQIWDASEFGLPANCLIILLAARSPIQIFTSVCLQLRISWMTNQIWDASEFGLPANCLIILLAARSPIQGFELGCCLQSPLLAQGIELCSWLQTPSLTTAVETICLFPLADVILHHIGTISGHCYQYTSGQVSRSSPANRLGLWDSVGRRSNGLALTWLAGAQLATDPPVPFGSDDVITVPGEMEGCNYSKAVLFTIKHSG